VPADSSPLLVLLLPDPLEAFKPRALADDLLQAKGVVAVDPPRTSYLSLARIPDAFGVSIALKQARRLRRRLPGEPRAVAIFHPAQYPLARGLLTQLPEAELWYGRLGRPEEDADDERRRKRLAELHVLAAERSSLTFVASEELGREEALAGRKAVMVEPGADHGPLWDRIASLRVGTHRKAR
jgi:hypothetical protein